MRHPARALVAITILAYLPVLWAGFVWDDDSYVEHNSALRSLPGLWHIWSDPSATPQYYPLVHTTFWVEAHVWGVGSAVPFHAANVLLHATSAVLVWRLVGRLLRAPGWRLQPPPAPGRAATPVVAWVAAAVWAVHPVMVESVAWVTERKNVLSGVFYLSAFGTYLNAAEDPGKRRGPYAAAFCLFLLALLSKTVTATLPAAVLVVLWWRRGRVAWRDVVPLVPFVVAGAALGWHTGHLERVQVGARGPEFAFSVADRVLIAGRAVWFYAAKLAVPWPLSFVYPRWAIDPRRAWQWAFPVAVAGVIVALWVVRRRVGRGPLAAALLFVGTLSPALGFANVYPMRYSFVADHFQYLASLALIVPAGAVLARRRWAAAVVIVACAVLTFARCLDYRDRLTLWADTTAKNPSSWMAHTNLGTAWVAAGRPDLARAEYGTALALAPGLPETHWNVASGLAAARDYPAAIDQCRQALAIDPDYPPVLATLAKLYVQTGDLPRAVATARAAVAAGPGYAAGYAALGRSLDRSGRLAEAADAYGRAVELAPTDAATRVQLADVDARQGRDVAAIEQYEAVVSLEPDNGPAWAALAPLLNRVGRPVEAAESLRRAAAAARH